MAGRKRSDSTHIKTQLVDDQDIAPPEHVQLRDIDMPFWYALVRARVKDSWNTVDLQHAANLARCQADIERIQQEILEEGDTLTNDRGTVVLNPKHSLLETLSRRSIALSKHIQVHAVATVGESDKQRGKNSAAAKGRKTAEKTKEADDLLARPS
ncbi:MULTISPECIES: hypothetical protein [Acinetobacter]|uniref:hypothetical protein n=1 Tax=Acinetobacter TaxID=469 RepID=UPI0002D034C5|nr:MULTISPECIES: hypothetical protein [Acinetobacter]ENX29140.1 hypothetical protein F890_02242 [Acinetobacter sp. CIP 64.7]